METKKPLTLTTVAFYGRQSVKISIALLIILVVGRTFLSAAVSYWKATHPAPPPPPTVGFGALPPLVFPAKSAAEKPRSYQLQTANGRLPYFGDRAKVFIEPKSSPNLLADQSVREIATKYGYNQDPTVLDARTYRWTKLLPIQTTLQMDIQNNNFSLTSDFLSRPELLSQKNLPTETSAITLVKSFVGTGQNLPADVATSSGQVTYLKSVGGAVSPAVSFSDADFLQVDLSRAPIDGTHKAFTPAGLDGVVHAVVSGAFSGNDQIMSFEYHYHPIDYVNFETYPIRSTDAAWQVLQAGEGYVATKGTDDVVTVRTVELGYYEDPNEQPYFQPIYVFHGDHGFLGFVPAIDPRYVQQGK